MSTLRGFLVLLLSAACAVSASGADLSESLAPDLILLNGKVLTMDDEGRAVEAIAIRGDCILAVGATADIKPLAGEKTRILDVGGRLVLPGLVDAHSHAAGIPPDYLDFSKARSIAEIQQKVAKKAASTPPGRWIVSSGDFMTYSGWDDKKLEEKRWLTRWDIDPVSADHPVLLTKDGGHAVVVNSYALRLLGIDKNTPSPKGQIQKDPETGEPTGALLESAMALAYSKLPEPSREELVKAAANAANRLLRWGTTTVADAAVTDDILNTYQALYLGFDTPLVSLIMFPRVPETAPLEEQLNFVRSWRLRTGFGDSRLKVGALKFFVDGGITSLSAWFTRPYRNRPGHYGTPQIEKESLFKLVRVADALGWQLHFHVCGDAAAEAALQALEAAYRENPARDRRHTLTHAYVLSPEQIARVKRLGLVVNLQPNFVYALGEHMRAAMHDDQLAHYMPFRSLLEAGVPVALSADGHPQNPLYGIYGAVARVTDHGNPLGEAERVTVMEAIYAYTRGSAYSLFEESRRGSIEPGKLADVIVLDRDITGVPVEQIKDAQVLLTVKHGRIAVDRLGEAAGGGQ